MSASEKSFGCKDVAPLLVFYVCEEVSDKGRRQIETHLAACQACAAQLAEERRLQETMTAVAQPADQFDASGVLLAQCRSELAEALDDLSAPPIQEHWRPFGWLRRWMALRPAWSGALLVLFGVVVGTQMIPWLQSGSNRSANLQAVNVMAKPRLTEEQLAKMAVAGINFSPSTGSAPGTLELQLNAEQPLVLSGNVDDSDMRRVLTYVVENGNRFDPGVRLDCLDALKAVARDQQVRQALIVAARRDPNPAVRIRALESLRDAATDDAVREMLLEELEHDANPGVRVEAVNLLVQSLGNGTTGAAAAALPAPEMPIPPPIASAIAAAPPAGDPSIERAVRMLEQLQRRDSSPYVRLRSAAALRQIESHDAQQ